MADYIAVVKRDCPTCQLVGPVLLDLLESGASIEFVSQDDPTFPDGAPGVVDDTGLRRSYELGVETVPTVIRTDARGNEAARIIGWERNEWRRFTGHDELGEGLPDYRPGCGSKTTEPGVFEVLRARYGDAGLRSRRIEVGEYDDEVEQTYRRGWTDGLPVVPPTAPRILRMLEGTRLEPDTSLGKLPPNLGELTVEKIAINAVMAGCLPEYMPVLIAACRGILDPLFTLHGLVCTTCFSSPIVVVNGPVARRIGMNWGLNALGQGNRANSTIGRALNLVIQNVGGGRPGEIDRSTLGGPGKVGFCFAEDETDPAWESLAASRGIETGQSAVTLFQGDGIQGFVDQRSRTPEELVRSLAMSLFAVGHPKLCEFCNALLVLSPEHYGVFREAGWDRARLTAALHDALLRPGADLVRGAQGVGEGIPADRADAEVPKFHRDGLLIARAGGDAGLFSAICAGWTGGRFKDESKPVTVAIEE